jgi:hypothetical protein
MDGARWDPCALRRGDATVGHMRPDARAFTIVSAARPELVSRRCLLIDDTYVSGARAQSAAAALRRAGARSVVIVVLGRVLRPDRVSAHATFLRQARFDFLRQARFDPPDSASSAQLSPARRPCARCVQAGASTE